MPYLERLDHQIEKFNWGVEGVGLDAGYSMAPICKGLADRQIFFKYDSTHDIYICPQGHKLGYRTTSRAGQREYFSDPAVCRNCSMLSECTGSAHKIRVITRHV